MTAKITKRDGRKHFLDWSLVRDAIDAASDGIEHFSQSKLDELVEEVKGRCPDSPSVYDIQRIVENVLMKRYPDVARSYIEYRHTRDQVRDAQANLTRDIGSLLGIDDSDVSDVQNENANKDSRVIPCQRDLLAGMVAKDYARKHILPHDVVEAHDNGVLHYHDMDYSPLFPMFNCMLVDLKGMLDDGFKMGNAEITSPRSITTATAVTAQIIAQVSSHNYGGTTINRIDEILSPYVIKTWDKHRSELIEDIKALKLNPDDYSDELDERATVRTEKSTYDAFQSLEYEVNTLHTANGQTPFVTFGYGLGTSWAAKLIQKSMMQVRIKGLGRNAKTAVFPKLVFAIKDGLNLRPTDPNYDIKQVALECASKRMYPDILNYDKLVENTGSFKTPMGCRSFLDVYEEDGKQIHDGRNNLGVVSVNLPRIALTSGVDGEVSFNRELDKALDLCFKALMTRIDRLRGVKASVAPILYCEGACGVRLNPDDEVLQIFEKGRASISLGYIGLHELANAVFGVGDVIGDDERNTFLQNVLKHLKKTTDQWKADTGFAFGLYATPSENLCTRFHNLDLAEFGVVEGVTDKGYYTNSFHLDVRKKVNPYEKIMFEKQYVAISPGGFICYGEYPNMQNNLKALENLWDFSYYHVPYYGTNTPIDECYDCGFTGEFKCTSKGYECPKCGCSESGRVSVTRRVCGYLGSPDARPFNVGKQAEVAVRVKHL